MIVSYADVAVAVAVTVLVVVDVLVAVTVVLKEVGALLMLIVTPPLTIRIVFSSKYC